MSSIELTVEPSRASAQPTRPTVATVAHVIQALLGCLMLVSGATKIARPHSFLADVFQYQLVGDAPAVLVAATLPWVELAIGSALVLNVFAAAAAAGGALLCLVFVAAQSTAWTRGLKVSCGCFGELSAADSIGIWSISRTAGLALLFTLLFVFHRRGTAAAGGTLP